MGVMAMKRILFTHQISRTGASPDALYVMCRTYIFFWWGEPYSSTGNTVSIFLAWSWQKYTKWVSNFNMKYENVFYTQIVGWLKSDPCFSHDQLYVGYSQVSYIFAKNIEKTRNIACKEVQKLFKTFLYV